MSALTGGKDRTRKKSGGTRGGKQGAGEEDRQPKLASHF